LLCRAHHFINLYPEEEYEAWIDIDCNLQIAQTRSEYSVCEKVMNQGTGDTVGNDDEDENIQEEKLPTSKEAGEALRILKKFVQARGDFFQEKNVYERYYICQHSTVYF